MIDIRPEILQALEQGRAVVALESTVIAHGLPWPRSLETARQMESEIRSCGAVPATIGIAEGRVIVGLSEPELTLFARSREVAKVSRRDLAAVVNSRRLGATTVAATAFLAHRAGIRIFATGGLGGVHRGGEDSLDISADLLELSRTPIAVVCSGAKSILDLRRTLEVLETQGVPVVGFGCDRFPAFYCRDSGLALELRVDRPAEAARLLATQWRLGLSAAVVIAHPIPLASALDESEVAGLIETAVRQAASEGIGGKELTPWLLDRLAVASSGRTLEANIALLLANARLAATISVACTGEEC